jgi:hypothetical protein
MGILTHLLTQTAEIVTTSTNAYGDQIPSTLTELPCRFRYITDLDRRTNMEGITASDAIFHFEAGADVKEGTILKIEGLYWRVDKLVRARRMGDPVLFLKAFVLKHQIAEGEVS